MFCQNICQISWLSSVGAYGLLESLKCTGSRLWFKQCTIRNCDVCHMLIYDRMYKKGMATKLQPYGNVLFTVLVKSVTLQKSVYFIFKKRCFQRIESEIMFMEKIQNLDTHGLRNLGLDNMMLSVQMMTSWRRQNQMPSGTLITQRELDVDCEELQLISKKEEIHRKKEHKIFTFLPKYHVKITFQQRY